jgi:hypothetical protein
VAAACACLALAACGKKGPPLPPLSRLPPAVNDLEGVLAGTTLELAWSASPPAAPSASRQAFELVWEVDSASGEGPGSAAEAAVGTVLERGRRAPGPAAEWPAGGMGRPQRLQALAEVGGVPAGARLRALVLGSSGRRSVPSNLLTFEVPQEPPPALSGFTAVSTPAGVRLSWEALRSAARLEIYRAEAGSPAAGLLPLVRLDPGAGEYVDEGARLGVTYDYTARLRAACGERAWLAGSPAVVEAFEYVDSFAPAPPEGLTLVVEAAGARLLWSPNRERDLAGYRVYRRLEDGVEEPVATLGSQDVTWVDADVAEGTRVEYRVTAFDSAPRANESAPSAAAAGVVRRPQPIGVAPERP